MRANTNGRGNQPTAVDIQNGCRALNANEQHNAMQKAEKLLIMVN